MINFIETYGVFFDKPSQPDYIIVSARQRSGSSTLSSSLGGHPCTLNGNEIWSDNASQDILRGHTYTSLSNQEIRKNPHAFLSEIHDDICHMARNNGYIDSSCSKCTVVVKMFDIHHLSEEGIIDLMSDKDISFVVLERDVQKEYCSLQLAHEKGDWGTTPSDHKKENNEYQCDTVSESFAWEHNAWFYFIRTELRKKGFLLMFRLMLFLLVK